MHRIKRTSENVRNDSLLKITNMLRSLAAAVVGLLIFAKSKSQNVDENLIPSGGSSRQSAVVTFSYNDDEPFGKYVA
jgi:hypothetical protein